MNKSILAFSLGMLLSTPLHAGMEFDPNLVTELEFSNNRVSMYLRDFEVCEDESGQDGLAISLDGEAYVLTSVALDDEGRASMSDSLEIMPDYTDDYGSTLSLAKDGPACSNLYVSLNFETPAIRRFTKVDQPVFSFQSDPNNFEMSTFREFDLSSTLFAYGGSLTSLRAFDMDGDGMQTDLIGLMSGYTFEGDELPSRFAHSTNFDETFVSCEELPISECARHGIGSETMTAFDVADLTGDGINDLVYINAIEGASQVAEIILAPGAGDGDFFVGEAIGVLSRSNLEARAVRITDLNGDGRKDLVVSVLEKFPTYPPHVALETYIQSENGQMVFSKVIIQDDVDGSTGEGLYTMPGIFELADMDGDGVKDIVTAVAQYTPTAAGNFVRIYRGIRSDTQFVSTPKEIHVANGGYDPRILDINEDGKLDIVTVTASSSSGFEIGTLLNRTCRGDFNGDLVVNLSDVGAFGSLYHSNDPEADLTGDGKADLSDLGVFSTLIGSDCLPEEEIF